MLVVGISFSTTLSMCCIICCVIFFIIVKRNKRLAYQKELEKKQALLDTQIGSLEETLKDVKAKPIASPSSPQVEQSISSPGTTGVLYKGEIRTEDGRCWRLNKTSPTKPWNKKEDMLELDSVQQGRCTQFEKVGIGKYVRKDNSVVDNTFIVRDVNSGLCLNSSLVAGHHGGLTPCPLDENNNVGVLNDAAVLTQESDNSIMVQHETASGTTCLGESTFTNAQGQRVPVTRNYGLTLSKPGCTKYKRF